MLYVSFLFPGRNLKASRRFLDLITTDRTFVKRPKPRLSLRNSGKIRPKTIPLRAGCIVNFRRPNRTEIPLRVKGRAIEWGHSPCRQIYFDSTASQILQIIKSFTNANFVGQTRSRLPMDCGSFTRSVEHSTHCMTFVPLRYALRVIMQCE